MLNVKEKMKTERKKMTREKWKEKMDRMRSKRFTRMHINNTHVRVHEIESAQVPSISIYDKSVECSFTVTMKSGKRLTMREKVQHRLKTEMKKGWFGKTKIVYVPFNHQDYFNENSEPVKKVVDRCEEFANQISKLKN